MRSPTQRRSTPQATGGRRLAGWWWRAGGRRARSTPLRPSGNAVRSAHGLRLPNRDAPTVPLRLSPQRSMQASGQLFAAAPAVARGFLLVQITEAEVLDLDVVVDAVVRTFAPDARLFDAAERHLGHRDQAGVDADHAVLERLGHAEDPADVAAVEVARQAELGVVGQ